MSRTNRTIGAYLLLVFGSGVAVGGFGYRLYSGPTVNANVGTKMSPEEWRRQYLNEMKTRVNLTQDQLQQVNSIMDETRALFHASREKHNQELEALRQAQANKVRAILSDEQRPLFEKLRAEREARAKAAKK